MKIKIFGSLSLKHFTDRLIKAFSTLSGSDFLFDLYQIHGAPHSFEEDKFLISELKKSPRPFLILIHRPDELLIRPELVKFFEDDPKIKIIFLGDLMLMHPFWKERQEYIRVLTHPYLDHSLPTKIEGAFTIGSYTSWGEMRDLKHFLNLVDELKNPRFMAMVGGTLNGLPLTQSMLGRDDIKVMPDFFMPHFNVQLYHLMGKKRLGESSGSLHRGISIPVIFEANGMERLENIRAIKVTADNDLGDIDFKSAALQIAQLSDGAIENWINHNLASARTNTPERFASEICIFFT